MSVRGALVLGVHRVDAWILKAFSLMPLTSVSTDQPGLGQ